MGLLPSGLTRQPSDVHAAPFQVEKVKEKKDDPKQIISNGRVLGSIILSGWSESHIGTPTLSDAVSLAMAKAIGENLVGRNVRVLKIESEEDSPASTAPVELTFGVVPDSHAQVSTTLLDRIEARMMLLGMLESQESQLFDKALASEMAAAGQYVQVHARFGAVWQQP